MSTLGFLIVATAVIFLIRSLFRKAVSPLGVALLIAGLMVDVVTAVAY